jgi:hypothetical protein
MKINAKITMLFDRDNGLNIHITDDDSGIRFVDIQMTNDEAVSALSRLAETNISSTEVRGLENLGKTKERKPFSVNLGKSNYRDEKERAIKAVQGQCPDGWKPDLYFNGQRSFSYENGDTIANTTIFRFVEKEAAE